MAKKIIHGIDAKRALKEGVDKVANAVRVTLGPRGLNVAMDKGYGGPTITNDGVSIAKEITLGNKFQNMGAEIVKEVANKTNDSAGDGTTTSVVLLQAMVKDGFERISLGIDPMEVRRGIEAAAHEAGAELEAMARPVKTKDEIEQVASISAESAEIGKKIAEVVEKVGKDGVVTVEESQTFTTEAEYVEGMEFNKGYISHYMVTNAERMEASYKDPLVLVTDKKISSVQEVLPIIEKVAQSGKKDLVIIAEDVDGEALATFLVNKLRGTFNVLAVKAPGYGDRKKDMLEDIAAVLGAEVISETIGIKFEQATLEMLGRASKVVATKDSTVLVGGKGNKKNIEKRIAQIRGQIADTSSKFDKEQLEERLAKLSGGVAVVRVGAATETEMKYLKLKIEDAVNATKAAVAEGIVPGGGTALVKTAVRLEKKKAELQKTGRHSPAFATGYAILINALLVPLQVIIQNTTHDIGTDSKLILARIIDALTKDEKSNVGFDAMKSSSAPDMFAAGIIDPLTVTKAAVRNAASAAGILLTTEVAIADEPKEEKTSTNQGEGEMDY